MGSRHRVAFLIIATAACGAGNCDAEGLCSGVTVAEVRNLAAIPIGIRQLLLGAPGQHGIADRGERFNMVDGVTPENVGLPGRRLTLAAVGSKCAVVGVEFGGIASGFDALEFRLDGEKWHLTGHRLLPGEPRSIPDLLTVPLLAALARQPVTLRPGKQLKILDSYSGGLDVHSRDLPVFGVTYETQVPQDDKENLEREANELWLVLAWDLGETQFRVGIITAEEAAVAHGTSARKGYCFEYRRTGTGQWLFVRAYPEEERSFAFPYAPDIG